MHPPGGPLQHGPLLAKLAADMCRAQGPSQALVVAAAELTQLVPSLAYVGLAVPAEDRQSVRYTTLHNQRPGAARLGAVAAASCAAGLAIDTKQLVHVRDLADGDLGLHDLQYLQQEHEARACFVAHLVVAHKALGALSLASLQPDAFNGHEGLLQVVAAMCAPYVLLLKSHEGLLALEGLVSQVLPMRVALQLQDQQRRSFSVELPAEAVQQQALPIQGAAAPAAASGPTRAGPSSSAAGVNEVSVLSAAGGNAGTDGAAVTRGGKSSLRELRAAQRARQQPARQQQGAPQQRQPADAPAHRQPLQQHALRQQQLWLWDRPSIWSLAFQQQPLELAYERWALQQWLRLLDTMFLLLVLLSALGSHVAPAVAALALLFQQQGGLRLPGISFCACVSWLLVVTVVVSLWTLHLQPGRGLWGNRRTAVLAAVRVLRTLLLCCELRKLLAPGDVPSQQQGGVEQGAGSVLAPSRAKAASCGLLLMLGLLGQLPSPLHAVVQAACLAMVSTTAVAARMPSLQPSKGDIFAGVVGFIRAVPAAVSALGLPAWIQLAWLFSLGWVVPVAMVTFAEWASRRHFLRKLM